MNKFLVLHYMILLAIAAVTAKAEPADLFPSISDWTITRDDMVYTSDNLWDLIDGAADAFLLYGFIDLHVAEYKDSAGTTIRAEVYRHSSAENTFGIYALERKSDYHFVAIGTQGYHEEGVLNFFAGDYYVKLSTYSSGSYAQRAIESLARAMDQHLAQSRNWPGTLELLPVNGKISNTEGYVAEGFLGYSSLHSAFTADYGDPSAFQLFVIERGSDDMAKAMLINFLAEVKGKIELMREGVYRINEQHRGRIIIVSKGKYLGGLIKCADVEVEERYITLLLQRFR